MSEGDTRRIERDLLSEPQIRARRISVRQVYALVEERGEDPEAVADRYDSTWSTCITPWRTITTTHERCVT